MKNKNDSDKIIFSISIVCVAMLSIAYNNSLPYIYYQILKFVVFFGSITTCFLTLDHEKKALIVKALIISHSINALIYNPFIPLHLGRNNWEVINFVSIILFIIFTKPMHFLIMKVIINPFLAMLRTMDYFEQKKEKGRIKRIQQEEAMARKVDKSKPVYFQLCWWKASSDRMIILVSILTTTIIWVPFLILLLFASDEFPFKSLLVYPLLIIFPYLFLKISKSSE